MSLNEQAVKRGKWYARGRILIHEINQNSDNAPIKVGNQWAARVFAAGELAGARHGSRDSDFCFASFWSFLLFYALIIFAFAFAFALKS